MKANIFKIREQVARGARKIVLKNFFISLTKYILFMPFILVIIICLSFAFILLYALQKITEKEITIKKSFRDFDLLGESISYFSKDSIELIFNTYNCYFKCKTCGKKCYYQAGYIDMELPLWQWLDEAEQTCYECYKKGKEAKNELL